MQLLTGARAATNWRSRSASLRPTQLQTDAHAVPYWRPFSWKLALVHRPFTRKVHERQLPRTVTAVLTARRQLREKSPAVKGFSARIEREVQGSSAKPED